ncbi:hypothetical protein [Streptomyces sp. NPDC094468]|uniref:hypothetical protein n=1 Tax=Streptomyces sp. NPDC094468 TaxID=3366066 RepID=UPI0038251D21
MPSPTLRPPRPRHLSAVALGIAAAIALGACSAGGTAHPSAGAPDAARSAPAARGVITRAAAEAVLDHYQATNNQANARRDTKLLATIEAGTLYAQDAADYKLFKTLSKSEQKDYGSPFTYVDRHLWIPPASSHATWFAATVTASTTKAHGLMIFDKEGGSTYKAVLIVYRDKGESLPAIAVDRDGWAVVADPAKKVGGIAPAGLHDAYEDVWQTGGSKEGTRLSAATKPVKDAQRIYRTAQKRGTADGYATKKFFATPPVSTKVYALQGADGSTVAVFSTAHKQESLVKPQYRCKVADIVPNAQQTALGAARGFLFTDRFLGQALASLTSRSARITDVDWQFTGVQSVPCPRAG